MQYKITAKDEAKQHLTVAFLTDKGSVFKTVVMDARFLPVDDAVALDEELSKQAQAMEAELGQPVKVFSPEIKLNVVTDATKEALASRLEVRSALKTLERPVIE